MDHSRKSQDDPSSWILPEFPRVRGRRDRRARITAQSLWSILALVMLTLASVSCSRLPDRYPIEVYHMLQERTQFGYGRENRARGTWGPWSSWTECSRSCGTGVQSQSRECIPVRRLLRKRSIMPVNGTSTARPICIGTYKRYHTCNTQECPNFSGDPRAEQCAKYNGRNYKGQSYVWVPFLDAPNSCALNCRAVGERFYATLEPAVIDGTPCDAPNLRGHSAAGISTDHRTDRWLCVAGQCKPVGCDGVVGSGVTVDSCGVCGGQGKGCRLYEGIFMEPILAKGHQPVTAIPKGAMSLNISELRFSGNFLALRDSNGSYILNGPWAYSPSGSYKAAGTTLTYQRGDRNRLECILATGPLNDSLHLEILVQEFNPGVLYKYMLPLKDDANGHAMIAPPLHATGTTDRGNEIPDLDPRFSLSIASNKISDRKADLSPTRDQDRDRDRARPRDRGRKEDAKHPPTTVMAGDQPKSKGKKKKRIKFVWKTVGLTPCTKECAGGIQTAIIKCVRESNETPVNERRCRNLEKPAHLGSTRCNLHPCPARWRAGPWTECSVSCGPGTRRRRLECVQELNSKLTMPVPAGACMQPPDLRTVETCTKPACPSVTPELRHMHSPHDAPRWDVGPWGPCSVTCGKGVRNRTVTCITSGESCPLSDKPESQRSCENMGCDMELHRAEHQAPWLYSSWSSKCSVECGVGIESRRVACAEGSKLFCNPTERPETERQCFGRDESCDNAKWFTGPWTSCSVSCGVGMQQREVVCLGRVNQGERIPLSPKNCTGQRPQVEQVCTNSACAPEWFISDWSRCSATCGGGTQTRLVRCILDGVGSSNCVENTKPAEQQRCNMEPCKSESEIVRKPGKKTHQSSECVDKHPDCALVVKNGLCRIKYYKHSCCRCRE